MRWWLWVTVVILLACQIADGKTSKNHGAISPRPFYIVKNQHSRRILGGDNVENDEITKHPYAAAILIHDRLWCAGAIVHTRWVLTAAHCLSYVIVVSPPYFLDYIKIRVGSTNGLRGGTIYNVTLAIRHPNYELEPPPHADVAMLKTASDIEFNRHVSPILIYRGVEEPYAQNMVNIVGWGAKKGSLNAFKSKNAHMKEARLKVRTMEYCELAYQIVVGLTITRGFFCASLRNGTRDACLFDAGSPAVQDEMLMGIMSFGPELCGDESKPAVFIRAWKFRQFVKMTIRNHRTDDVDLIYTTVSVDSADESSELDEKSDCVTKPNVDETSKEETEANESDEVKKNETGEVKMAEYVEAREDESGEAKKDESDEAKKDESDENSTFRI